MANIVRVGGGNPSIAEIWMSQGTYQGAGGAITADCNQKYYSVSAGNKNKLSAMNFPSVWNAGSGTLSVSFTPMVNKIHCVILPYSHPGTVSIVSSTAEYEKIGEYKSAYPDYPPGQSNGFELVFKNLTVGTSYSMSLSFSNLAILGLIMIVYDD